MQGTEESTLVWVRTDVVEAVLSNGGESLPPRWKPTRKRGRSDVGSGWGWARAIVVHSSNSLRLSHSPFGQVRLRKVTSPRSPPASSSETPLTVTIHDGEFAPSHLNGVTVTVPRTLDGDSDECPAYMANSWWQRNGSRAPNDLTGLTHLHEAAVVYCLKRRYEQDVIYTYTGKILLALNPFRECNHLYGAKIMRQYCTQQQQQQQQQHDKNTERPPPHVYATAQDAYGAMMRSFEMSQQGDVNANQSILVSGESGAGKTVTTKIIMRYLATLSRSNFTAVPQEDNSSIESQVLQSNPILESFGNARTVRNDNSSRFGKFIEIQFLPSGTLFSASIETYLLEKVRIATQAPGERNYHIFYELLDGASQKEKRLLQISNCTARDFQMTSMSGTFDRRDGVRDRDTYRDLIKALQTVGFSRKEQIELFTVACAVLHASNLTFEETGSDGSTLKSSNRSLKPTISLMGVTQDTLNDALCTCAIEARGETLVKNLSMTQATKALEAFIKATYGALFAHIVQRINSSIKVNRTEDAQNGFGATAFIGLLDIFGFESFEHNSFEQLCINYCNEALQQQFNRFVFKLEQKEYQEEGIEWSFISFPDNQDVLDLIDKKHSGILSVLDEQCRLPQSTDTTFARATYEACSNHPRFVASNSQKVVGAFSIHHYAGPVAYETTNFLEKSKDELPKGTTDILMSSSHPLLPSLAEILSEPSMKSSNRGVVASRRPYHRSSSLLRESVGSQFRSQLTMLRSRIENTTPHYVRCLKPNDDLIPKCFDALVIADQLRCAGVLEAIRVSRVGFPHRYEHQDFVQRYHMLSTRDDKKSMRRIRVHTDVCEYLVKRLSAQISNGHVGTNSPQSLDTQGESSHGAFHGIQMGRTKVFLRREAFEYLELMRNRTVQSAAACIQAGTRMYLARTWFEIQMIAVIILQSFARRIEALWEVRKLRHNRSARIVQTIWRRASARKYFIATGAIAIWCQKMFRAGIARDICSFLYLEHKASVIAKVWRMCACTLRYQRLQRGFLVLQCRVRTLIAKKQLIQLKCDARDLDAVRAERDKFRAESANLKRELESARRGRVRWQASSHRKQYSVNENSTAEVEQLRKEVERLKREREIDAPPPLSITIPSEPADHVEELYSLASECAQKDRELERLRNELATLRRSPNASAYDRRVRSQYGGSPSSFRSSPTAPNVQRNRQRRGLLSPLSMLFGKGSRPDADDEATSGMAKRNEIPSPTRSSLLDAEDRSLTGFASYCSPTSKHMENSSMMIEEIWSSDVDESAYQTLPSENLLLHRAASDGDEKMLRFLIHSSPDIHSDINQVNSDTRTPLHLAALTSNVRIASLLLESGAVANAQDQDGSTPLHLTTSPKMTQLLLEKGRANPNIPNFDGVSALHLAVRRRDVESVKHIMKHDPDVNAADNKEWFTPLHLVASSEFDDDSESESLGARRKVFAELLCNKSIKCKADLNYQDIYGNTPLHHAAMLSTPDAVDLFSIFLRNEANPSIVNKRGQTILHMLCHNDELRKIRVLDEILHLALFHGANPNRQSVTGCTALHLSLYHNDMESAIQLVNSGAELHLLWKKPGSWAWAWEKTRSSSEVMALDMVRDEHSLHRMLAAITKPQKPAPRRSWCMQCNAKIGNFGRAPHCGHCGSLVCVTCSPKRLDAYLFPKVFGISESTSVCKICEKILLSRREDSGSETQPNSSIQEDSEGGSCAPSV